MSEQITTPTIANILIAARQSNEDVGELVAAALHMAAENVGGAYKLVQGRPGSWEADIVMNMAFNGGSGNEERIGQLATLFVELAEGDGGDWLSQEMSCAVDALGGLRQFAGESRWYWDLVNMGKQYSQYWDSQEY